MHVLFMAMTSHKPYLIRALYEWILDNGCTPYILANAMAPGVEVPQQGVKDGQVILNINPQAVKGLLITNEMLEFDGRFGGIPKHIRVPVAAVHGIYARENGQGMIFEAEEDSTPTPPSASGAPTFSRTSKVLGDSKRTDTVRPILKVIK
jgi:stringent starvation protein B